MSEGQLSEEARRLLLERLQFCEANKLHEGAEFFRAALQNWNQTDFENWARIDDLAAHPKNKAELEGFRRRGMKGLGEKDIRP